MAWLCISEGGRRVEEREKELYGILKNNNIPTIIVITKAQQDKDEKGVSFQEVVKELFNTDDFQYSYKLDLIQKSRYKLASYLIDTLSESQIDDLMGRVFSFHDMPKEDLCKFIESVPDSVKNTKTFADNIAIEVLKRPYLIKYIDEMYPYMLVSIMAKASSNNRTEEVRQELLASGKVNEREIDQAANYLVRFYKHDFGGDFE